MIESGRQAPLYKTVESLLEALGLTVSDLKDYGA